MHTACTVWHRKPVVTDNVPPLTMTWQRGRIKNGESTLWCNNPEVALSLLLHSQLRYTRRRSQYSLKGEDVKQLPSWALVLKKIEEREH